MCSCFGTNSVLHFESNKLDQEETIVAASFSVSTQLKEAVVRIVHAGGRIEIFENALPASKLLQKNPGMCIAMPEVFRQPHESVLSPDDVLLPGNKYFVVRCTTVEKLKRRKRRKNGETISDTSVSDDDGDTCVSGDYSVTKNGWSILRKHMNEKKQFVPPIQRPRRIWKDLDWEPSLVSIKEVSP